MGEVTLPKLGRFEGTVLKYDKVKSFGFIKIHDKTITDDAFIYYKDIEPNKAGFKKLMQGDLVEFDVIRNNKGLVAKDLVILKLANNIDEVGDYNGNC